MKLGLLGQLTLCVPSDLDLEPVAPCGEEGEERAPPKYLEIEG